MSESRGPFPLYYRLHVFCCVNERAPNHTRGSCARKGSNEIRDYMKQRAKELGITDVRINASGCLDRCELGPTMVVYPDGIWYRCASLEDADQILARHIQGGEAVEHLVLHPDQKYPQQCSVK